MTNPLPVLLREDADTHLPLPSGAPLRVLCGLAWLFVAWSFSFLDRSGGAFGFFAGVWLVIGVASFGLALLCRGDVMRSRKAVMALGCLAGLFVLVGFAVFILIRWAAFALLLVTAARAPAMRTRRDLYYALAGIVAVSLLVLTHSNAQWTVWFYLAPAWLCVALALAWDYASGVRLSTRTRVGLTAGFLAVSITTGVAIAALVPLPRLLGLGFLEPGTDNPGRTHQPAGHPGAGQARATQASAQGSTEAGGDARTLERRLQEALADPGLPGWQRTVVSAMLASLEAAARIHVGDARPMATPPMTPKQREEYRARAAALRQAVETILSVLQMALIAWLVWLLRWRIAASAALGAARLMQSPAPGWAMRCSMWSLRILLRRHGHPMRAGESVLEHVGSAPVLPGRVRDWLLHAAKCYGASRFGGARPVVADAAYARDAVIAAGEVLRLKKNQ